MTNHLTTIQIVDKYETFCYGIKYFLDKEKLFQIIKINNNIEDCLKSIKIKKPSILLLNLCGNLNYKFNIINKLDELNCMDIKLIVIIERYYNDLFNILIHKNAMGFFTRETKTLEIVSIFKSVISGQVVMSKELSKTFSNMEIMTNLNVKELKILELISNEKTNKEIAEILNYSQSTIEYYVTNILNKLSANNRVGAVNKAKEFNLL